MKWLSSLRRESTEEPGPASAAAAGAFDEATVIQPAIDSPAPQQSGAPQSAPPGPAAVEPLSSAAKECGESTLEMAPFVAQPAESTLSEALDAGLLLHRMRQELQAGQQELVDSQRALNELFSTRLRSDEAQARAVEKLHDELRQYKTNFVRQQLLPLLKEVIFCHDFLTAQIERLAADAEGAGESAGRTLAAAQQMLADLMFKYDVEPFRAEGEQFDPKCQQCTHTSPTDRAEADKSIAGRGLTGFRSPEGVVRREQVIVYKFTPGAD